MMIGRVRVGAQGMKILTIEKNSDLQVGDYVKVTKIEEE